MSFIFSALGWLFLIIVFVAVFGKPPTVWNKCRPNGENDKQNIFEHDGNRYITQKEIASTAHNSEFTYLHLPNRRE